MKPTTTHRLLLALAASLTLLYPTHAQLSVEWITQYGSSNSERGQAIAVDVLGQSWVAGYTFGNLGGTNAGGGDYILSRLSPAGTVDFTQQRGGTGDDVGRGVALVGGSTVFAGGWTGSNPLDGQATLGGRDAFAGRFDTSGTWQGTTRIGSSEFDQGFTLAGNATHLLMAGGTYGDFDSQSSAGDSDAFLTKRDSNGALVWTRFAATTGYDEGRATAFDNGGNAYLAGYTQGSFSGFSNAGQDDFFVTRYDSDGNRTLLKQLGTSGQDFTIDMEVDLAGNIYLTGSTTGALGGQTNAGNSDASVMKLDGTGSVLWTRLLGGSDFEESLGLALDGAGHVWIGGYSGSISSDDAFVAQYDTDGNLLGTTGWPPPVPTTSSG